MQVSTTISAAGTAAARARHEADAPVQAKPAPATHTKVPHTTATHAPATALTVKMLDGFSVWQGSAPLAGLPHGRVRTLLKLLLLQRRHPVSSARLVAACWPEADADSARNNLHVALHRLRRALGEAAQVRRADEGYQLLAPGEVWIDTEQFVRHAEAGAFAERHGQAVQAIAQYESALALYQRDLLDEGGCESALAAEANVLRDRLSLVLERLSALREQHADWHGCLRHAHRQLEIDACNEPVHRRMMLCYSRLGQLRQAERQYRQCVDVLRGQFGIGPSEETTALYRRIASRQGA